MKLLIADDDRTTRVMLTRMSAAFGYTVLAADDGAAALAAFRTAPDVNLVISDWDMPGLDGPSLLAELYALRSAPYLYTVLVSAREDLMAAGAALSPAADDLLAKPFSPEVFRMRLSLATQVLALPPAELIERHRRKITRAR